MQSDKISNSLRIVYITVEVIAMKRLITFLLCFCMIFLLCACGANRGSAAGTETTAGTEPGPLDGKKIIFIGNSHTYAGNVVTQAYNQNPRQEDRDHNP